MNSISRVSPLLFIVSAPAGTGKTTLVKMLTQEFPNVVQSVSCTTRSKRPGEVEGRDYYFLSEKEFQEHVKELRFLENAKVFDASYGTLKEEVEKNQKKGNHVVLVIDTQGAKLLREQQVKAVYIFIRPPSVTTLEERLQKRNTETEQNRMERLSWARHELSEVSHYDYLVVNDELENAYEVLRSIVIAEQHRV